MSRQHLFLVLVLALHVTSLAAAQDAAPARLTVRLPARAKLYVEGVLHPNEGPVRTLVTPPLESGANYSYDLRVEQMIDGSPVNYTKTVTFRAGETQEVQLGAVGNQAGTTAQKLPPYPTKPSGPGNIVVAVARERQGSLEIELSVPQMQPETRTRTKKIASGEVVTEQYTTYATTMQKQILKGAAVQAFRKDGTPLALKDLTRLLNEPTQVLLVYGEMIDPYYLGLVRDDAIILVTKGHGYGSPTYGGSPPIAPGGVITVPSGRIQITPGKTLPVQPKQPQ